VETYHFELCWPDGVEYTWRGLPCIKFMQGSTAHGAVSFGLKPDRRHFPTVRLFFWIEDNRTPAMPCPQEILLKLFRNRPEHLAVINYHLDQIAIRMMGPAVSEPRPMAHCVVCGHTVMIERCYPHRTVEHYYPAANIMPTNRCYGSGRVCKEVRK
jgi:hypothetical protein